MAAYTQTIHGARLVLYVNGRPMGVCTEFSWSSNTPMQEKGGVDIQFPIELAPGIVRVSWSMTAIRTLHDAGMEGWGLVAEQGLASLNKYFTMELVDRGTKLTMFKSEYCQVDAQTWRVAPKQLLIGQVSGKSILWVNDSSQ